LTVILVWFDELGTRLLAEYGDERSAINRADCTAIARLGKNGTVNKDGLYQELKISF